LRKDHETLKLSQFIAGSPDARRACLARFRSIFSGFWVPRLWGIEFGGQPLFTGWFSEHICLLRSGWNNSNLFVGNNGIVAFPNTYDFFRVPTNYEEVEELAENAPQPVPNQDVQSSALPRTSDALQIEKERNAVIFSWNGTSDSVNRITFTLLDRSKQPIRQRIITRLPATARLTRSNRTAYYRVTVEYINGTTNSVIAPL
jgi:hypothetical protein